jgi:cytochrome c
MSSLPDRLARILGLGLALVALSVAARADQPARYGIGTAPTPQQIAGWALGVRPDGEGLPPGSGSVQDGDEIFADNCAACHGTFGEGAGRYPRIAGEGKLTGDRPEPTIGSYWPYATTVFDYINRAMPFPAPHSLTAHQVYAVTAYLLNLNGLVDDNFVASKETLPKVKMPNHDGFIWQDPRPDTHDTACMTNCRPASEVKIISTAEGKALTPRTTGPLDTALPQ